MNFKCKILVDTASLKTWFKHIEEGLERSELKKMVECISLEEINTHKTEVEKLLKERIPIFQEVKRDELEFIQYITTFANENLFFSYFIKENSQVS